MIDKTTQNSEEEIAKRRFPGIAVYLSPFRIVEDQKFEPWKVSMEEVNFLKWDYAELHRIVGGIEVGLREPFYLIVCRDGALYLPWIEELRADSKAVEFFNHCLSGLMLGGIYCEAVNSDNLDRASTLDWKYVRTIGPGASLSNTFHFAIRYQYANPFQASQLLNPRTVQFQDLKAAMGLGLEVLGKIPTLKGEYLLRGITGLSRRDWGSSLANLWIVVEQILQAIWENQILKPMSLDETAKERLAQLRDTRTWTAANRIELLTQKGIIPEECIRDLSIARKARNALSHTGKHPSQDDAKAA